MKSDPFPADMGPRLKLRLHFDMGIFGTAFYEETADGYERIDPVDVVVDSDGPPEGVEVVPFKGAAEPYGTPPIQPKEVAERHDIPFRQDK